MNYSIQNRVFAGFWVGRVQEWGEMRVILAVWVLVFSWLPVVGQDPEKRLVDGVVYWVLTCRPESVRVVWKDGEGKNLRTLPEAVGVVEGRGEKVAVVMNGGIFEPGGIPSGLLVQDGKELNPVNRREGEGNFFLKPNGIFLIGEEGAAVVKTEEYPLDGMAARHAIQSGPLLLRKGVVHPVFRAESESRLHRNGVGVTRKGEVVFVMTDFRGKLFPNLHEFAMMFRHLGCEDALFLDGDLSQMRWGGDLKKESNQLGAMIVVVKE